MGAVDGLNRFWCVVADVAHFRMRHFAQSDLHAERPLMDAIGLNAGDVVSPVWRIKNSSAGAAQAAFARSFRWNSGNGFAEASRRESGGGLRREPRPFLYKYCRRAIDASVAPRITFFPVWSIEQHLPGDHGKTTPGPVFFGVLEGGKLFGSREAGIPERIAAGLHWVVSLVKKKFCGLVHK